MCKWSQQLPTICNMQQGVQTDVTYNIQPMFACLHQASGSDQYWERELPVYTVLIPHLYLIVVRILKMTRKMNTAEEFSLKGHVIDFIHATVSWLYLMSSYNFRRKRVGNAFHAWWFQFEHLTTSLAVLMVTIFLRKMCSCNIEFRQFRGFSLLRFTPASWNCKVI